MTKLTTTQREAVRRAACDLTAMRKHDPRADEVDVACETGNFFWQGMTDRQARIALRAIYWPHTK